MAAEARVDDELFAVVGFGEFEKEDSLFGLGALLEMCLVL